MLTHGQPNLSFHAHAQRQLHPYRLFEPAIAIGCRGWIQFGEGPRMIAERRATSRSVAATSYLPGSMSPLPAADPLPAVERSSRPPQPP